MITGILVSLLVAAVVAAFAAAIKAAEYKTELSKTQNEIAELIKTKLELQKTIDSQQLEYAGKMREAVEIAVASAIKEQLQRISDLESEQTNLQEEIRKSKVPRKPRPSNDAFY